MRRFIEYRSMVEEALPTMLPPAFGFGGRAIEAARYSLLSGGKRMRSSLLLAACDFAGGDLKEALPAACAIECLYTYVQVHDDLPAMDDDAKRNGKPSCHTQYGENYAILAGDGLNTHAFWLIAEGARKASVRSEHHMRAMSHIASAAGFYGMISGQAADITLHSDNMSMESLRYIHFNKTAQLMRAALLAGACIAGADGSIERIFGEYGTHFGLAFQAADDILDSISEEAGNVPVKDVIDMKPTCVALLGIEGARARVLQESEEAILSLAPLGAKADFFIKLIHELVIDTI